MSWEPELAELAHRQALAAELGGAERVARQRATGRRTVRERVDDLLDEGTFAEVGSVAGTARYADGELTWFIPASVVAGAGAGHRPLGRWSYRIAWPSGDWGSLPIEGGLEVAYKRKLADSPDAAGLRDEIAARLEAVRSPFRTAEAYLVEEVVDPADTRPLLCEWAASAHDVLATLPAGPVGRGLRP